ncbi:MAG: hypothetical protein ACOY4Q_13160 [Bacillota bacterium]
MNNKLCERCSRNCKQTGSVTVVECRHFRPEPVQLEFKFKRPGGGKDALKKAVDKSK